LTWDAVQTGELLQPQPPFYFFTPFEMDAEYFGWPSIEECLPDFSMCVTTGNDNARVFLSETELETANPDAANVRQYLYRPFDSRWINHSAAQLARARADVMEHFYHPNVGLLALGQTRREGPYDYSFVTTMVTDKSCLSTEANCSVFPLRRYLTPELQAALPGAAAEHGQPIQVDNVRAELLNELAQSYGQQIVAEQVFYYIYAVLNAHEYLERYEDQLRREFPHIPFPVERQHFQTLAGLGRNLADAHLGVGLPAVHFPFNNAGNGTIDSAHVRYIAQEGVQVNGTGATFGGITPAMWEYRVGIHQPLNNWLQERHGRVLALEVTNPAQQVSIDEYRGIARRIASALAVHLEIDNAWNAMCGVGDA
jgi:hypothetical protein